MVLLCSDEMDKNIRLSIKMLLLFYHNHQHALLFKKITKMLLLCIFVYGGPKISRQKPHKKNTKLWIRGILIIKKTYVDNYGKKLFILIEGRKNIS